MKIYTSARKSNPIAPPEIRQRLENSEFAEQLSKNPNYLYTVIFRLTKRGELARVGDRYQLSSDGSSSDEEVGEGDILPQLLTFSR